MEEKHTIEWIANLRVLATISVIVVHVSMESRYGSFLYADLIYGGFVRFCVPIFVMISGALLLPRKAPLKLFIKKWPVKILLPLVFWSIPYVIYNLHQRTQQGEMFTLLGMAKETCKYILQGTTNFHFWYVYMIVGIYLFIPIIGAWVRSASQKEILYFLMIWFVVLCLQLPVLAFLKIGFDFYYFGGYLGFLVLGYYLSVHNFKYQLWYALLIVLAGYLATVALTLYVTRANNAFTHTYYDYLRPNIVVLAAGIFLTVKKMDVGFFHTKLFLIVRNAISKHSYGIYLVHWMIVIMLAEFHINWQLITPLAGIPLTTICCLVISFICVWLINKLPFGKYVSG